MEKGELVTRIDQSLEIARQYDEPWSLVIFEKLLERLLVDWRFSEQGGALSEFPSEPESRESEPEMGRLSKIVGVGADLLREVFRFEADAPVIRQYDFQAPSMAAKAREVCGLYLLACTVAYNRESVPYEELVSVAKEWNVYDSANFSGSHIGKSPWFHKTGDRVKLLLPARQEIASVVKRVLCVDALQEEA